MRITVDAKALLDWADSFRTTTEVTKGAVAKALNKLGDTVVTSLSEDFAASTGLTPSEVRKLFDIKKATSRDLFWEMDVAKILDAEAPSRKLPKREIPGGRRFPALPAGTLVDVITAGDVFVEITAEGEGIVGRRLVEVCDICIEKAEEGPYTIEEVQAMGVKWADFAPRSPGVTNLFHPNCLLPGTVVEGDIILALKAFYAGPVVEIITSGVTMVGCDSLTVTIQHPILTTKGFVPAGQLCKGMKLVCKRRDIRFDVTQTNHKYDDPTTIEEIFGTLVKAGSMRQPAMCEDFHGDGRLMNSDVEIVTVDRELLRPLQAISTESFSNFSFIPSDMQQPLVACFGSGQFGRQAIRAVPSSFMGESHLPFSGSFRHVRPFQTLRLGSTSNWNIFEPQRTSNYTTRNSEAFTQLASRYAREIELCDLVDLRIGDYVGHVYDLQTTTGYIVANDIAISNCRCTVWPTRKRASQITYKPRERPQPRVRPIGPSLTPTAGGGFAGTVGDKTIEAMVFGEWAAKVGEAAQKAGGEILRIKRK